MGSKLTNWVIFFKMQSSLHPFQSARSRLTRKQDKKVSTNRSLGRKRSCNLTSSHNQGGTYRICLVWKKCIFYRWVSEVSRFFLLPMSLLRVFLLSLSPRASWLNNYCHERIVFNCCWRLVYFTVGNINVAALPSYSFLRIRMIYLYCSFLANCSHHGMLRLIYAVPTV